MVQNQTKEGHEVETRLLEAFGAGYLPIRKRFTWAYRRSDPSRKNPTVFVNNEKENENESKIKILATKFDLIWAYFGGTII